MSSVLRPIRAALVLLVSLGLVATACSSSNDGAKSSAPTPAKATPSATTEGTPSFYATTMNSMWEGFVLSSEDVAFNWILGEFGADSGNGNAEMLQQLQAIQQQLVQLNTTLQQVNTSILQQTCDQMYGDIAPLTGRITLLWQEYETLLGWNASTGQYTNKPLTDTGDIDAWISDASGAQSGQNPGPSVLSELTTMQQYLDTGGSGADSSITACIKAIASASNGSGLPSPGTMDDRSYYTAIVQPALNYYYGLQLQAMIMYVQMNNYLAWQAAGSPTSSSPTGIAQNVCGTASFQATSKSPTPTPSYPQATQGQSPTGYCELAYNFTVTANQQIRYQWAQAGAPYSDGAVVLQNGTTNLWVTDLASFNGGSGCIPPGPTPTPTCGAAAGKWNALSTISNSYDGRSSWATANAKQWGALINPNGVSVENPSGVTIPSTQTAWNSGTLASWLETKGFVNVGPWVVWTGDQANGADAGFLYPATVPTKVTAACLVVTAYPYSGSGDNGGTGMQPFCTGWNNNFGKLTNKPTEHNDICISSESEEAIYPACYINGPSDFGGFFNLLYQADDLDGLQWKTSPQWRLSSAATQPAFHWPVMDVSAVTCSSTEPGATKVNPAGVPSMCGADLTAYLNAQVPPPTS